jgi:hypothetical protein
MEFVLQVFSPSMVEQRFLETMKAIQGALIVSSSIQIILGYSQLWGIFSRSLSFTLRSPSILALLLFPSKSNTNLLPSSSVSILTFDSS